MIGLIEEAKTFARRQHEGQADKLNVPYFHHVEDVAKRVAHLGPVVEAIAWLHDVVEDTATSLEEIEERFGSTVRSGVDAMTKRKSERYFEDYLPRLQANPDAVAVKIADALHNWSKAHLLRDVDPRQTAYFEGKYERVLKVLGAETKGRQENLVFKDKVWTNRTESNRGSVPIIC